MKIFTKHTLQFHLFFFLLLLILGGSDLNAQINVVNTNNAAQLAQKLAGDGVVISNSSMQCEQNQSGLFVAVSSNLGQDSGIILTTGLAGTNFPNWGVNGGEPNLANFNQGNNGDAALTALAGTSTFDRCILEFDFKANGDSIFFKYVFGSEEYPAFNCTNYNDVFGFFISGPGYASPLNIALIPGTTIPVAINSINNGVVPVGGTLSNCTNMGAGSPFTSLYVNNTAGTSITYSGFTQVLTARASIQPCSTYHLKLAIADGFDHILDSGVFLKAGSLTSNTFKLKVTTDSLTTNPYVFEGCDTAIIRIKRKIFQSTVNTDTVTLSITGTATSGVDYPSLTTTHIFSNSINDTEKVLYLMPINDLINEGSESVKIKIFDRCGTAIDSIQIDIKDPPKFTLYNNDTTICIGKSVQINGIHDAGLNFTWTPTAGVSNPSLFNPIITPTVTTSYTLTANYGSCYPFKDTLTITVQPLPTVNVTPTNLICNGTNTGSILTIGTAVTLPLTFTINPPGFTLSGSPANFTSLIAGTYTITATSGSGCTKTTATTIIQPSPIVWGTVTGSNIACNGGNIGQITSSATGGTGSKTYTLLPPNTTNTTGTFTALGAGTYTVIAKDANNCSITSAVIITQTIGLGWGSVAKTNINCNGINSGTINALITGGVGTISYVLNPGAISNTTGAFTNLSANTYTLSGTDANNCSASTIISITQPPLLAVASASSTGTTCNGGGNGTIHVTATGGVAPYTYTATPGNATNSTGIYLGVTAGTFTITISDANGCTKTTSVTVTQPPSININSVNTTVPNCVPGNNGSISINANGGIPSLTYSVNNINFQSSNSFSNLASNIYTVVVKDASGCTKTSLVNIVTPNVPVITNSTIALTCANSIGTINVTGTSGIGPYTYTLLPQNISNSTGIFPNLIAGTYTVVVSGTNGCTANLPITLTQPPNLLWQNVTTTQIPCTGGSNGSINLTATGGINPITYHLMPGNINNTTGIYSNLGVNGYTITATDAGGCTNITIVNIGLLPGVTFNSVNKTNATCFNATNGTITATATGAISPINYTLNPGALSNTTGNFINLASGIYTISASDGGNCTATSTVNITQPSAILISNVTPIVPSCIPGADGGMTIITAGGATPYSYSLNNGPLQGSNSFINLSIATYTIKVTDANGCTKTSIYNLSNPNAPSFSSLTSNQVACSGTASGTVTAIVTGGVGGVNFTLNPGGITNITGIFANLPVNNYTVTAADANGCAITSTISINQPSQIVFTSATATNISCANAGNGHINVVASGGVGTYTYTANPGNISNSTGNFISLGTNNYTITASDVNGCTVTTTFNITQPSAMFWLTASHSNACNNLLGSISSLVNGGTPFYSYHLMPGNITNPTGGNFISLTPGTYTVTGTDANNCTLTSTYVIGQSPLINITSIANTIPNCNPGNNATITVSANGGSNPLAYNLNGGANQASNLFTGIGVSVYTVNVVDAIGCTKSTTVNITNPSSPSISGISATPLMCFAANTSTMTSVASGGVGTLNYTLNPGSISNTTGVFSSIGANNYTVTVTDANLCSATSNFILSQPAQMIWDSIDNRDVSCFGGSNGLVTSHASGGTGGISYTLLPSNITNISGAFFGLTIGNYTLNAIDSNGCIISSAFSINQSPPVVWTSVTSTSPSCNNGSNGTIQVSASGGNGGFEYKIMPSAVTNLSGNFNNLIAGVYTITAKDIKSCTQTTIVTITSNPPVQLGAINTTFATCNPGCDGTASLAGVGGTGIYSYSVNGGSFQPATNISSLCAAVYTVVIKDANNCSNSGTFSITTANGPTAINNTITPISCNGLANGGIVSNVIGGTGIINYLLNPTNISNTTGAFNNLALATYTITGTDANGCTISSIANVTQPFPLLLTGTNVTSILCFGANTGGVSTTAIGGNGSYSYSLTPTAQTNTTGSFTSLIASIYTINVVDSKGCTNSITVNITSPNGMVASAPIINNVSCFGGANGSATQLFTGGAGTISYTILPVNTTNTTGTFTGLISGTYTVSATDVNGCTASTTLAVGQPSQVAVSSVTSTPPTCIPGGDASVTINATGGTPTYTYAVNALPFQASNNFTNIGNSGIYTVSAKDAAGCTATSTMSITAPNSPMINSVITTQASCNPGCDATLTVNSSGGTGAIIYSINVSPFQASNAFNNLCSNTYTVVAKDASGCTFTSVSTISTTSSPVLTNVASVNLLCNSGNNGSITLTVTGGTNPINYTLMPGSITNTTASFTNLSSGTYSITGIDAKGCTLSTSVNISQPGSLQFNAGSTTPPLCFGGNNGSLTVNTSGGTGIPTYAISPVGGTFALPNTFNNLIGNTTYTITGTDANGCSATTSVLLTQPTAVVINNITSLPVLCQGAANGSIAVTASGGVGSLNYTLQPTANTNLTGNFIGLSGNTYTIVVADANACSVSSTSIVNEPTSINITNATSTNIVCHGQVNGTITLQAAGGVNPLNYALQPSNITNTTGSFTALSAAIYTVTITDANNCTLSTTFTIVEPPVVAFSSLTNTSVICFGQSNGVINAVGIGGVGTINYNLLPGNTTNTSGVFNGLATNTYTVSIADANGCSATSTTLLNQPTQVIINSLTSSPVTCNGASNGSVLAVASGGVGAINYTLQPGATTNATGSFAGLNGNTYTISVADANACSATSSIAVFEPTAIAIVNATSTDIICYGQINGTVTVAANGGTNPLNYTLQPSNVSNTTGAFTGLTANTYTVTITDANNCTHTTTLVIIEPPLVVVSNLTQTNILCHGQSNGTINVVGIGGVGTINYTLQPGAVSNTTGLYNGLPINTYTISIVDANGCSASSTTTLTEPNTLVSTLDSIVNIKCHGGNNGLISVSSVGGTFPYIYTLQPLGLNSSAGVYGSLLAGNYTMIVTDVKGCMDSVENIILTEPTAIQFDLVSHQDIACYLDSSGSITVAASGGTGTIIYQVNPNIGTQTNPGFFENMPGGNYTVTAVDANNCTITTAILIKQNLQIVTPELELIMPICHGEDNGSIQIAAQGGVAPLSYSLDGGQFTTNGLFVNQKAGIHTIIIMDAKGCSHDTTFILTEPDLITADVKIDGIFCVDQSDAKVTVSAFGGRGKYTYYLKPGLFINKSGKFTDVSPGTYTLSITDSMQCRLDTLITVSLPSNPLLTAISSQNIGCFGVGTEGWAQVNVTGGTVPYSFLWNTTPLQTDARATDLSYGWYKVEVVDANGCIKKDSVYIEPGPCCDEMFIPNAFTPNGDGKNDVWRIVTAAGIELLQLDVYDRWGNRVWSATDITQGWDGTYHGKEVDLNTFYYLFRYRCLVDGQNHVKKGDITVIK